MKTIFPVALLMVSVLGASGMNNPTQLRTPARMAQTQGEIPFLVKPSQPAPEKLMNIRKGASKRAKAMDVPFIEDFSSSSTLNDWGVFDMNSDGNCWQYDEKNQLVKFYTLYADGSNDDWLSTPAINLGADDIYTLTFSVGSNCNRESIASEALTVTMGTSEDVTAHTTTLFSDDDIRNFWNGKMRTVTITLPVEKDGAYYFGFHCTSPSNAYCIYLDDIRVEQNGSYDAPEAPILMVSPGENGELSATLHVDAPVLDASGKTLKDIDGIRIYRDDKPIMEHVASPGEKLTVTDADALPGTHTYKAVAYIGNNEGAKAEASAWFGVDEPLAPAKAIARELSDGRISLEWDASAGVHGGYTGGQSVTYTVTRINQSSEEVIAALQGVCSLTDTPSGDLTDQGHCYYTIVASTSAGNAKETVSNSVFTGAAYQLPFSESFANCRLQASPWIMEVTKSPFLPSNWQLVAMGAYPTCPPVDGDDGMALFLSTIGYMNLYAGSEVRLSTPAIDLTSASDPQVSFYLFHYDTTVTEQVYDEDTEQYNTVETTFDDKLHLQISVDNGDYTDIPGTEIKLAASNAGWTKYTFSLANYKNAHKASIGLVGYAEGGGNICIDKLLVEDRVDADLAAGALLGPLSVKPGETANYVCTVTNRGVKSTKDYMVDLVLDGKTIATQANQGAAIFANGGEKIFRFSFTPEWIHSGATHSLKAVVRYAADQCEANNESSEILLEVASNGLPKVEALSGAVVDGKAVISWDEPDFTDRRPVTLDDMEAHAAFAISGIGDYTLIDNDKASATCTVSGVTGIQNASSAMSWQVFNPSLTSLDLELEFNRRWIARSGNQYLVAWGASDSNVSANDDWLISPQLSGEEQVVSFYIKGITLAYPERFRVLYSTDTKSISDFVKVAETTYYTPTSTWRRFSVRLPQGARYFAIQCISADGFGLMVDDLSCTKFASQTTSLEFMGYNVYRDGKLMTATPIAEPSFTDETCGSGAYSYTVSCLFSEGESAPSEAFVTASSGVSVLQTQSAGVTVRPHIGCIEIDGYDGEANVYDIAGHLVGNEKVEGNLTFTIAPGAYVVKCGDTIAKVLVK